MEVLILLGIVAACASIYFAVTGSFAACRWLVSSLLTPEGHVRVGAYRDTKAYAELAEEQYGVTPDWRSDAIAHINQT